MVSATACVLIACARGTDRSVAGGDGARQDSTGIGEAREAFAAAALKNDPVLIASFYADSALFVVPGLPTLRGRLAIEALFRKALATTHFQRFTFQPDAIYGGHGTITEVGHQSDVSSGDDGRLTAAFGRYLITWVRNASGTWQMAVNATVVDSTRPTAP